MIKKQYKIGISWVGALISMSMLLFPVTVVAEEPICAVVKIEIEQTLTLERQAFDARMKITNGLDTIPLENVNINVNFEDSDGNVVLASSDPNNTSALFFIRVASTDGIDDITGAGTIAPQGVADIHWLIIPAPGAGGQLESGKQYLVGATLTYDKGGVQEVVDVAPDAIYVKPMPLLTLDYFLPSDVTADDAFTTEIEPPVPFSLGVRVNNNGSGVARNLKIESAQPKIVENEQGLLIGFKIEGSTVNDQPTTPSLLADFGDIQGNSSGTARWLMTVSLSGRFTEFTAEFSHADALGGELTSLLEQINTHFLIQDVLVDVPGRDGVRDFLARDGDVIRVYESDNVDTEVTDVSANASFSLVGSNGIEETYNLIVPVTAGFLYAQVTDPFNGSKLIKEVIRSDGKRISEHNAWLSQSRPAASSAWNYFFNLFDANSTGSYTVVLQDSIAVPQAPVLQYIPDRVTYEGNPIGFFVDASDPNGTIPVISAAPLPNSANFVDQANGIAQFQWTPTVGQAGTYTITYKASDGVLEATRIATIRVNPAWDTDGDGMDDDWERANFGDLSRDGTGDFDNDGIPDLQEYLDGTDPLTGSGLTAPTIDSPLPGTEVTSTTPALTLANSVHAPTSVVNYDFEIYSDESFTSFVTGITGVVETLNTTAGTVATALNDNTLYYWRARAFDGLVYSQWVNGRFFVNTANDAPAAFNINFPADASEVDNLLPLLSVLNSSDIDGDTITYNFDVFDDSTLTNRVAFVAGVNEGAVGATEWTVTPALTNGVTYYWRVTAVDEHGAQTESAVVSFTVNTGIQAPGLPSVVSPTVGSEVTTADASLVVNNATDPTGNGLVYYFEIDTVNSFDSINKATSDPIVEGAAGTTTWTVTSLTEDTLYYWRAKASTGTVDSGWVQSSFIYNAVNSAPSVPTIANPDNFAWVETVRPVLSVHPSVDADNDAITYRFELYSDQQLTTLVRDYVSDNGDWSILFAIADNTWSYWRVRAEDEHGAASNWTTVASFFVNNNGIDDAPTITMVEPSSDVSDPASVAISWDDTDPDSNASITLFYDTDNVGADGVLIVDAIAEDSDGTADTYTWDTSTLDTGTYYVYAEISDGVTTVSAYATGAIIIPVRNNAPVVANPIPDQTVDPVVSTFQYSVPANTFSDPDGDALSYSVAMADATALPAWLSADATGPVTFIGAPTISDLGKYDIRVTATDTGALSTFDDFTLCVASPVQTTTDVTARARYTDITLVWTPVADADSYKIYRSGTAGGPYELVASDVVTNYATYMDTGLVSGVTYFYVVRSVMCGVDSLDSNEVSATTIIRTRTR